MATVSHRVRRFSVKHINRTDDHVTKRAVGQPHVLHVPLEEVLLYGLHVFRVGPVQEEQTITPNGWRGHELPLLEVQITTAMNVSARTDGLRDLRNTDTLAPLAPTNVVQREPDARIFRQVRAF